MITKQIRIAVYGAGAMGTVLGAYLTKGGLQVDLITRNKAHVQGMREKGATVLLDEGEEENIPVNALLPTEMTGKYDVIFLMTKQRHNEEILTDLLAFMHENTVVCTTQNGLPEQSVAKIVGAKRTYGAATSFGATFLGEGRVALTSKIEAMRIEVGGYQNNGENLSLLAEILSYVSKATGNDNFVKTTDNLLAARWAKLAINAAFSGLSVVTGMTFGEVAKRHKTRKIALGILQECMLLAKTSGVTLATMQGYDMEKMLGGKTLFKRLFAYMVLPFAMKKHKSLVSGMLKDIENGKKCEIDFVNGVVVREGERLGLETPLCRQVVEMVHGIENGLYEISYENVDFFA